MAATDVRVLIYVDPARAPKSATKTVLPSIKNQTEELLERSL